MISGMTDLLKDLNPKQKEAAEIISGPVLVIAGPGSGKTKTLTHRIAHLISSGVSPANILAVTFTNKAAGEMKERVRLLLPITAQPPQIGTFHSICARILRKEANRVGYSQSFSIYDTEDSQKLIKNILQELSVDAKQFPPQKVLAIISSLKNELVTPDDYEMEADSPFAKKIAAVYKKYSEKSKEQNSMDFDDLLVKVVELFGAHKDVLDKYRRQFEYVLIDEFQDTNLPQYKIANYLAAEHRNIYCIGDLDQSIYSFRGADYRNILYFEKDWPDVKVITLEQNYRSTQNILDAAHAVISLNSQRKEKNLWTSNGTGDIITIKEAQDGADEGDFIISEIQKNVRENKLRLQDFVVLYRTNAQSRAIEEAFLTNGFPYKIVGGIKFYQRKEIKDILAWVRLCANRNDAVAFDRVSDMPVKFLLATYKSSQKPRGKANIIQVLLQDITQKSKDLDLTGLIKCIIQSIAFEQYLRDGTEKGEERWDNVGELISVTSKFDNEEITSAMHLLLEEASLYQDTDDLDYQKDLVTLMTLHAVKGLEFPVVFITGFEQGLLPHSRSLFGASVNEIEEERRLCYVGLTRAKQKLYLTFARQRTMFGRVQSNPPSEFLAGIPAHTVEYLPADEETVIELD